MLVKRVGDTHILDVFTGKGWSNWSRFEVLHNHGRLALRLTKGQPMRKEEFKQLYEELNK